MELVIEILMLFIFINTSVKLSFWKGWQAAIFGLICAGFVLYTCQYAILQSKTQLVDYLNNKSVMQDIAVLITMESVICFAFGFTALLGEKKKKYRFWKQLLLWYPSLLIFPVLFYLLTQTVYALPGADFTAISYALAAGVFLLVPLGSRAIKRLCPEREFRLEIYFLVSLFVSITGLITTVNGNVAYAAAEDTLNLKAIALSAGLFLILFLIGLIWNKIKWILFSKKRLNKNCFQN